MPNSEKDVQVIPQETVVTGNGTGGFTAARVSQARAVFHPTWETGVGNPRLSRVPTCTPNLETRAAAR